MRVGFAEAAKERMHFLLCEGAKCLPKSTAFSFSLLCSQSEAKKEQKSTAQ
jgi:hypothetical protein